MPDDALATGFFGKLPATGDFVARGLPDGFRRAWDAWVTRHLAPRQRAGCQWPEGGLRFRLRSGGRDAAGVIVPSRDSADRDYPLSVIVLGTALTTPANLDAWMDDASRLAAAALDDAQAPDDLWAALDALPPPPEVEAPELPSFQLWSHGTDPIACDPTDPGDALNVLLPATNSD